MDTLCGVDFHARSQTVRYVSACDGEILRITLDHACDGLRGFYASLPGKVTVGIEAHGYTAWFEQMLFELGYDVWIGDAAKIRT